MNLNDPKLEPKIEGAHGAKGALHRATTRVAREMNDVAMRLESKLVDHALPLPDAIDAEKKSLRTRAGQEVSYYVDRHGQGRPLLLVHSVNAAASSYETRPLFLAYRGKRPVYAVDLPGFGASERDERSYTPHLFVNAIEDVLRRIKSQHHDQAADVVALSLSSEFVARAALEKSRLVHSLALISPTGLGAQPRPASSRAGVAAADVLQRVLTTSPLGQIVFDALVSRPSVAYFLSQQFAGKVDPGLKEHAYATAHQPGARFAPLAFLGGGLFTPDARESIYAGIEIPALVLHDDDPHARLDGLADLLARAPSWKAERIEETRGLPHFEKLDTVTSALDRFWTAAEHFHPHGHHAHAHH